MTSYLYELRGLAFSSRHVSQCNVKNVDKVAKTRCRFVVAKRITHMNYQPRGISDRAIQGPASYLSEIGAAEALLKDKDTWNGVNAEAVARMRLQNRFKTGLDVARYTAALMRADMAAYDADKTKYT